MSAVGVGHRSQTQAEIVIAAVRLSLTMRCLAPTRGATEIRGDADRSATLAAAMT